MTIITFTISLSIYLYSCQLNTQTSKDWKRFCGLSAIWLCIIYFSYSYVSIYHLLRLIFSSYCTLSILSIVSAFAALVTWCSHVWLRSLARHHDLMATPFSLHWHFVYMSILISAHSIGGVTYCLNSSGLIQNVLSLVMLDTEHPSMLLWPANWPVTVASLQESSMLASLHPHLHQSESLTIARPFKHLNM